MAKAGKAAAKRMFTMGQSPSDESAASTRASYSRSGGFKDVAPKKKKKKK